MPEGVPVVAARSTFRADYGTVAPSSAVRALTQTMIAAVPKVLAVASLRADVMMGKTKPVEHVLRLMLAAIDSGCAVDDVTLWLRDADAYVRAYAARRAQRQQSVRVLPFPEVHARMVTRSIREDAEADCATAVVDLNDIASLEAARQERLDSIAQDQRLVECYTRRIAELRADG